MEVEAFGDVSGVEVVRSAENGLERVHVEFMGSSENQIFPFFHGVPVAPLKVIGPRGDFHLLERALVDTGAALTSVPISVCRQDVQVECCITSYQI